MLWALATQNTTWLDFLQTQKFGPLIDYYAALPGGGSREGTGYGTAQKNLFENYIYWKASTGEDLAGLTPHTRETIDYWVHATVPTRDRFAPIGDQSRVVDPGALRLPREPGARGGGAEPGHAAGAAAARGGCRTTRSTASRTASTSTGDLLPYPDAPLAPTDLVYHAAGAGALFARIELGHRRRLAVVRRRQVRPVARAPGPGLVHVLQERLARGDQQHLVAQRHPPGRRRRTT